MLSLLRESDAALPAVDNGRLQAEPRLSRSSVWRDGIMKSDFTPVITGTEAHLPCFLFVYIFSVTTSVRLPGWLWLVGYEERSGPTQSDTKEVGVRPRGANSVRRGGFWFPYVCMFLSVLLGPRTTRFQRPLSFLSRVRESPDAFDFRSRLTVRTFGY